ncbi:MAG: rhamnulokinase [Firmicutes bacterium]|nr:rhamnulokinase [Bacillota bacterium]
MKYYLAVDFGASSGRHILCHAENERLVTEEIYRFENGAAANIHGTLCWDIDRLFGEIKTGMKRCADAKKIPVSVGIDTWGVDFVLVDKNGRQIGDAVSYRDKRTEKSMPYVEKIISGSELYMRTGIQKAAYNTIYQLASYLESDNAKQLEEAKDLLMLPDYFNYLLTGVKMSEYTEATTSGLVNAATHTWDVEIISKLGLPHGIFGEIHRPARIVGMLKKSVSEEVGFECKVVMTASHDTASAIMAIPSDTENDIYISSGTWSLMGIEAEKAALSEKCMHSGLSNEGGYNRINCLKNIMGLWMIQQVRHEYDDRYSFAELCDLAEKSQIDSIVDCNDNAFLSPKSMRSAIDKYCEARSLQKPDTVGDYARIIYRSLAKCYAECAKQIESLTGKNYGAIHIIGGGSNAGYLNRLTAEASGKTVYAGPAEATALGNIAAQMIACGDVKNLSEFKQLVANTFEIRIIKSERMNK